MERDGKLFIKNSNGEEKEYSILVTFDIEQKNKSYMIYTDYSVDENNKLKVYAGIYNPYDELKELDPVVEKDEIDVIERYLVSLAEDLKSGIKLA